MKIDARRVGEVLQRPGGYRAALIFGPDEGLVRERVLAMSRSLLDGERDDPFRMLDIQGRELKEKDVQALVNELATPPLTGGQRVVRVRDTTDRLSALVKPTLSANLPGFLLLAAGDLTGGSSLRKLLEPADRVAVIACYPPDAAAVAAMAAKRFREEGVHCDPDALELIGERLEGDTGMARQSIETLALFAGPEGRLDADAVLGLLGDHGSVALDEAMLHAFAGESAEADHGLARALADGSSGVAILRIGLRWLQRLQGMRAEIDAGGFAGGVVKAARPPVFWKLTGQVERTLRVLDAERIEHGMLRLLEAERACKRTGAPDALLATRALMQVGTAARRQPALR